MATDGDAESRRIGLAVRQRRKALGLSQQRLAGKAGVSTTTIQNAENGRFDELPYTLPKIADALGTTLATLIAGDASSGGDDLDGVQVATIETAVDYLQELPLEVAMGAIGSFLLEQVQTSDEPDRRADNN